MILIKYSYQALFYILIPEKTDIYCQCLTILVNLSTVKNILLLAVALSIPSLLNQAMADTEVLPAGARALVFKLTTAEVPGSYGLSGQTQDFSVRETLGVNVIQSISPDVKKAYQQLHDLAPQAAEAISLGKIDMTPEIKVKATTFALAWGLTDRIMIAAGVPIMKGDVAVHGGFITSDSIKNAATALRNIDGTADVKNRANALAQALEQLPTVSGENVQSVIVNDFGYKPVGSWTGSGIGDVQLFLQAKTYDGDFYKNGAKIGSVLPTGRTKDPDNLVDIPFGNGYFSPFVESIHDFYFWKEYLVLSVTGRYEYAMPASRTYRLSPSTDFPLTSMKEDIPYKPGNVWSASAELSTKLFNSFSIASSYTIKTKAKDSISGTSPTYNYSILEYKTDYQSREVEAGISYSTVDLFLKKKFAVPFKVGFSVTRVVAGRNTEQVNTSNLNFEMYF